MKLMIGVVVCICLLSAAAYAQEPGSLQAPKILPPERFDQWGDLRLNDENARLDKIALQAKEWSMSITYLVIHAGQTACVGEAKARGIRARNYLMHQGISPERIVFIDGGWRKKVSVEVWIWPPELGKPKVASDLDLKPGAVRLERNCKLKYRVESDLPRSGYVSKPRVASTLGKKVPVIVNPERVAPPDATALRLNPPSNPVTQGSRSGNPGL